MKHLNQEQLVDAYYGGKDGVAERRLKRRLDRHLGGCDECASAYDTLKSDLAAVSASDVPERAADYGAQIWSRVAPLLPPRPFEERRAPGMGMWRGLSYAAGCAVLVAGAFYVGTVWEHYRHAGKTVAPAPEQAHAPAQPKVVVVVLGDHLDRSERLLVELKHADSDSAETAPLKDEARGLLAANRVFREDAEKDGDADLSTALSHLDKLLTGLADHPGQLDAAALSQLKDEMNADGLLFEVRVLRSKNPHRNAAVRVIARGGTA
ncbi:MAG TPA: hypothetical protein VKB38_18310 [Terracidiphilus sp.]|nr:hypothetical protein [Terracidiphilus sp.]